MSMKGDAGMNSERIVAVGEVVWDLFPDKRVLGGAPVNVAYQLSQLGVDVSVITRIGQIGRASCRERVFVGV